MGTKHNEAAFDSFTAAANELRFASGTTRIELAGVHLGNAKKDLKQAFYHAVGAGDFDRADAIGEQVIAISDAMNVLVELQK